MKNTWTKARRKELGRKIKKAWKRRKQEQLEQAVANATTTYSEPKTYTESDFQVALDSTTGIYRDGFRDAVQLLVDHQVTGGNH